MSPIDKLEPRLGRFALPGILKVIAGFQILVYVLLALTAHGSSLESSSLYHLIDLNPEKIAGGQIWRLFSFMFLPLANDPIFVVIHAWFLSFINAVLEEVWGTFRLNVFVVIGMIAVVLGALFLGAAPVGFFLFSTFIMAAGMLVPNHQILLFFIIPVKMKWVGLLSFAFMVFAFLGGGAALRLNIVLSLVNFAVFFGPGIVSSMKHQGQVSARRRRFEEDRGTGDAEPFFTCAACGKTDVDDPEEEFRVGPDGEEYCAGCRAGDGETS